MKWQIILITIKYQYRLAQQSQTPAEEGNITTVKYVMIAQFLKLNALMDYLPSQFLNSILILWKWLLLVTEKKTLGEENNLFHAYLILGSICFREE